MRQIIFPSSLAITALLVGHPLLAKESPSFGKDLTATIGLQGMPCDKVIEAKRNGDSDYTARCKDGNRYHVFVDAHGRVIVQKI
jgi:hypothetical protein